MKPLMSLCSAGVGCDGYCAAIECRRVQVPRPNVSTSGGHSREVPVDRSVAVPEVLARVAVVADLDVDLFCDAHAAKELHERQLHN